MIGFYFFNKFLYKLVLCYLKSYSFSSSKDLMEYNGDFGSRLWTSMSCFDVIRPVRTIFCNNDFSDGSNSLSSSVERLLCESVVGTFIFPDSKHAFDN